MSLQILKEQIEKVRQDSHIVLYKINRDNKLWNDIIEYDKSETRRLGRA